MNYKKLLMTIFILTAFIFINTNASGEIISIEAEDMDNLSHAVVCGDSSSWAGAYLDISSNPSGNSSHSFSIPVAGNYNIWLRLKGETPGVNYSAILNINGIDIILSGNNTTWEWTSDDTYGEAITLNLAQGENVLSIRDNLDILYASAQIDSIIITDKLNFIPPDIPPTVTTWSSVTANGFNDQTNTASRLTAFKDGLYAGTTNTQYKPCIYKINPDDTTLKLKDLSTLGIPRLYMVLDTEVSGGKGLFMLYWKMKDYSNPSDNEEMYLVIFPRKSGHYEELVIT